MEILTNVADIVKVLGGSKEVAGLTFATREAVFNWTNLFKAFPANTYVVMTDKLKELGYGASPHLWKMRGCKPIRARSSPKSSPKKSKLIKTKPRNRPGKAQVRKSSGEISAA